MSKKRQYLKLRAKKLGLLIYDARLSANKSEKECSEAMGITLKRYRAFESGYMPPSLPELESLAYYFKVPLEHFQGHISLAESPKPEKYTSDERVRQIRDRIIGTRLRMERTNAGVSLRKMTGRTSIGQSKIKGNESGERPVPLPELEAMAEVLNIQIDEFIDHHGQIGTWRIQQQAFKEFLELSPELQQFVCKPVNRPYLELAISLSDLPAGKLRTIAESLLDITF